jgi:hypothetical protein
MKTLIFLFLMPFTSHALESQLVYEPQLLSAFTKAKTVQELAKKVAPYLNESTSKFVSEKLKGQKPIPVHIEKTSSSRLVVTSEKVSFTLEFKMPFEFSKYIFKVNQNEIIVSDNMKDEALLKEISEALPKLTSKSEDARFPVLSLFIPEAHAQMEMMMGMLGPIMSAFLMSKSTNGQESCNHLKNWNTFIGHCEAGVLDPTEMVDAINYVNSSTNPAKCATERDRLRSCLQGLQPAGGGAASGLPAILPPASIPSGGSSSGVK